MNRGNEQVITVDIDATEHSALTQNAYSRQQVEDCAQQNRVRLHIELSRKYACYPRRLLSMMASLLGRAMTAEACLIDGSACPSRFIRALAKHSTSCGSAVPV
jgi:hypothetical protein